MRRKMISGKKESMGSNFSRRPPAPLSVNDEEEKEEEEDEEEDEERKGWSD